MSVLAQRLLAVHTALETAGIDHAFGGAIALAYCTFDPRGTQDLDINIFVPVNDHATVLAVLPPEVTITRANRQEITKSGQTRLWWDTTPVDVFFNTHPFHEQAASRIRRVPFDGHEIPVLDCLALAVFKAMFNRTKDWADIEAMNEAGQLNLAVVRETLSDLLGNDDPRIDRLTSLETRT